jgi:hypothetical protein
MRRLRKIRRQCARLAGKMATGVGMLVALLAPGLAQAQAAPAPAEGQGSGPGVLWVRVDTAERLSQSWLAVLEQQRATASVTAGDSSNPVTAPPAASSSAPPAVSPPGYALGLMWVSPTARPAQRRQLRALLAQLPQDPPKHPPADVSGSPSGNPSQTQPHHDGTRPIGRTPWTALRQELASMPVTGRVPLPAQDPHWLAANPHLDPELAVGDEWWLPPRPAIVRVWLGEGNRCDLPFEPGLSSRHYISACEADSPAARERAWLVQPDGRVQRIGLAAWNRAPEPQPAPGAWLWAPRHDNGLPEQVSEAVAQWLATQGAAGTDTVPSAETLATAAGTGADTATPTTPASDTPDAAIAPAVRATRPAGVSTERSPATGRAPEPLASDWGVTGLLQTPTARTRKAGSLGLSVSRTYPYTHVNLVLSPFDRLEVAVRYTNISNLLYGPDIAGNQSYKDKSAELKWRLLDEGTWTPAVAVGLRDLGGTGFFGGEYLVANKRWGDWDVSLGLGWGHLGQRGNVANPLAKLGLRSDIRQGNQNASGGTANVGSLFSGPTALFGGLQWQLPWGNPEDAWAFRLEWDGNDHDGHERLGPVPTRSGLNAGLTWRWGGAEMGLSYQRGNRWSLNMAWFGDLSQQHTPKASVPRAPLVQSLTRPDPEAPAPEPAAEPAPEPMPPQPPILVALAQQTGWHATGLSTEPGLWTAHVDQASGAYLQERVERAWAVLHREAPPSVSTLRLELSSRQLPLMHYEIDRHAWADARSRHIARHQVPDGQAANERPVAQEPTTAAALSATPPDTPRVYTGVNLSYQQHLGGPDGYLYALSARAFGQLRAWDGAWLQGSLNLRLLDNYHLFKYTAPSNLPRVRTLLRDYVTSRRVTLPNLQFTQVGRLSPGLYGMVYAGWLEPMFAGVGAELLYRPLNSPWALGLDLNLVRQREVEQDLGLMDYRVVTGHLTLRWDTGWNDVIAGVSAGQYLAGDRGITVDLARAFSNGTRMGIWATKTNVSAEQFGEGSFDKGLYFSLPFDALFTRWSGSGTTVAWQPLIRDGGAKLQRGASLWGLTELRDSRLQTWHSAGEP